MINDNFQEIAPATLEFSTDLDYDSIIGDIELVQNFIDNNMEAFSGVVKNSIWHGFYSIGKLDVLNEIQKDIYSSLAVYCDNFDEAIHAIQWQEKIQLLTMSTGEEQYFFNPSKSLVKPNKFIDQIPFSRQICAEYYLNDNYVGGEIGWRYFNLNKYKPKAGTIIIYPATFLHSKYVTPIIDGRRDWLFTCFNGGKDYVAENNEVEDPEYEELLFSYLR